MLVLGAKPRSSVRVALTSYPSQQTLLLSFNKIFKKFLSFFFPSEIGFLITLKPVLKLAQLTCRPDWLSAGIKGTCRPTQLGVSLD